MSSEAQSVVSTAKKTETNSDENTATKKTEDNKKSKHVVVHWSEENEKILDFDALLASFGDSRPQSYSTLFKKVYDHCGIIGLDPKTCMLGLYVCQSSSFEYAK